MRIVLIADSIDLQSAGIHVYTLNMIRALEKSEKHEIICIRQGKRKDIRFKSEVIVRPFFPFLEKDPFRIFFKIPRAINKLKPDVVIETAHFGPFNLHKRIKRVTVIHDLTPIKYPGWHNRFSALLQRLFFPSILKRASMLIVNSENTQNDLLALYSVSRQKTAKIYPGVDPFFKLKKDQISQKKEPFFLTTGTLEPRKNLPALLEAYQLFRDKSTYKHKLVICGGKGWKNKAFYHKLEVHPYRSDIEMKGYVSKEELKSLYLKTSGFIYPSLYEGFGFPVAEAMHCGAPCIVSRVSSLTEVGDDAVLYFNPLSPAELALCMDQLTESNELQLELIEKGYKQALNFEWEKYARELEKELENLAK
ncbi:MAG: glycosyltransferase family 4 protein [Prolixibacteraceae bacterium]|nr:glycosyltransferase family 4 protein [Prolixibacteraceae bacterium]